MLHVGFCRNYVTSFISKASDALFHYPKTFVNINSHNQTAKEHNKMLSNTTIIRAWRDKTFRASLSQEQMQNMPEHPCGIIELSDDSLRNVAGGT
ncbi:MAG: mersacidin/lichenicidin family type 2 lantibiotic, partial [Microthrixaceae bacterium]|nr:mersacidin/lichenicidin family type 2 lantibiotic [Microthrixaceae bacterium]